MLLALRCKGSPLSLGKYYDHMVGRQIDMERDGCPLNSWAGQFGKASFARHPKGFPVFLPPNDVEKYDEYRAADPYDVDLTVSEFHQRRAACTLEMMSIAVNSSKHNPRILDLGCGRGHITARILRRFPHAEISALDSSISAIEYAADHFSRIDFAVGNAYDPPYSPGYFDIVVCNNLWEYVPDPLRIPSRIRDIMQVSGYLILSTPNRYSLENLVRIVRGKPVLLLSPHHVTEYSVGQVIEQLRYGGFDMIHTFSRPLTQERFRATVARTLLSGYLQLVKSHHNLEATVFYLARRRLQFDQLSPS